MHLYLVTADDNVIAALYTQGTTVIATDRTGRYEGTEIIPVNFNAEKTLFINELYTQALDRAPDRKALTDLSSVLDVSMSRKDFLKMVYTSDEFNLRYKGNQEFVDAVYVELLGRRADKAGQQAFVNALDNGTSRADVIDTFIQSTEFVQLVGQSSTYF